MNLSLFARSVLTAESPRTLNPLVLGSIDRYINELGLRDDHPDAIGQLHINAPEHIPAQSWQTIEVTYSVGSVPMVEGGRIMLARQFMSDGAQLQRKNPSADGYVLIRSSNQSARWKQETVPWYGAHGGFRAPIPVWSYRLEGTTLKEGDSITLTYGDTSGGGRGMQVQTFSNDAAPLLTAVLRYADAGVTERGMKEKEAAIRTRAEPAGEVRSAGGDATELAAEARAGLEELIARFDDPETPYEARPRPGAAPRYSAYEHLARIKEWTAGGGGEE